MQFDRIISGIRVVNAGSVGMPFGRPGADWALLGCVRLRHTLYDLQQGAARIRNTAYPQALEFRHNSTFCSHHPKLRCLTPSRALHSAEY